MRFLILLLAFCLFEQCFRETSPVTTKLDASTVILDSVRAAKYVLVDSSDRFFENLRSVDMRIQMKGAKNIKDEKLLSEYKKMLASDVCSISQADSMLLLDALSVAKQKADKLDVDIWPKPLFLIITKGKYYGDGTWYTRENCIVMPRAQLKMMNREALVSTILHEVFHVWSRRHTQSREAMYACVGYKRVSVPLKFPTDLGNRLLMNPDAADYGWYVNARRAGADADEAFVPCIHSKVLPYSPIANEFFGFLELEWHVVNLQTGEVAQQGWGITELEGLLEAMGDNTDYVLHPEELCADHFSMLALEEPGSGSPRGKQILKETKEVLLRFAH